MGSKEAYEHFLPAAQKLPAADLLDFKADAALALHNVQVGVAAVLADETSLKRELPGVKVTELAELPRLAQAVVFAALQVNRDAGSDGTIAALLARAYHVRKKLLAAALALAEAELVPKADVLAIQAGRGRLDAANDCVALAALFDKHAHAVKSKSPVSASDLTEASEVGSELQTLLKPRAAGRDRAAPAAVAAAAEARDRLWTLLVARHDWLWRVGAWLFGRDVDERVPALQSRVLGPRKPNPAPPPAAH
jgi:hypothetical protein